MATRNPPRHPRRPPRLQAARTHSRGCGGRPTRLGRTGAAGGAGSATHGAQPRVRRRTEIEQDSGRGGRGEEERRGAVKLGPSAPRARVFAHGRAALLPPPPPALRPSPPPAACRPARPALPGPPPTELCRYHFRREKRARRRTRALCAGERKCSEAEAADRNGRCAGMGRLCGRARGTRGSSGALGMVSARFLHTRRV